MGEKLTAQRIGRYHRDGSVCPIAAFEALDLLRLALGRSRTS